jgi:hypothetical protein
MDCGCQRVAALRLAIVVTPIVLAIVAPTDASNLAIRSAPATGIEDARCIRYQQIVGIYPIGKRATSRQRILCVNIRCRVARPNLSEDGNTWHHEGVLGEGACLIGDLTLLSRLACGCSVLLIEVVRSFASSKIKKAPLRHTVTASGHAKSAPPIRIGDAEVSLANPP